MQLELPLKDPQIDLEQVARLAAWLYRAGDEWIPARRITELLGLTDRQIRQFAAASRGRIVSGPGAPGYKHVRHCDQEEVSQVTGMIERQARSMAQRALEIRRAFHQIPS